MQFGIFDRHNPHRRSRRSSRYLRYSQVPPVPQPGVAGVAGVNFGRYAGRVKSEPLKAAGVNRPRRVRRREGGGVLVEVRLLKKGTVPSTVSSVFHSGAPNVQEHRQDGVARVDQFGSEVGSRRGGANNLASMQGAGD